MSPRALLSVYDKTGLEEVAKGLLGFGFELVASGGTAAALRRGGIVHLEVAEVTGAPEMLGGRVKTLHPSIHGGILADRSVASHLDDLERRAIAPIDVVVCNLYPFASDPSVEMIDIGGPAMVRAAAKNHAHVAVVVDPTEYATVLEELGREGTVTGETRLRLARAAFAHTAAYDAAIVQWLDGAEPGVLPPTIHLALERVGTLRYGENPHQAGARYRSAGPTPSWWDGVVQHGGRELSYLNLFDAEAAWTLAHELAAMAESGGVPDGAGSRSAGPRAAAVIVKHANACGAAVAETLESAYRLAFDGDQVSAFGGIVALPGAVDDALAACIVANPLADVLIARGFSRGALELFGDKRKNMRVLEAPLPTRDALSLRQIGGGFLVQEPDEILSAPASWKVVTKATPTPGEWAALELAWRVCGRTSSNAIVLAVPGQVVGVGCGQQNRLDAAAIAAKKAGDRSRGAAAASDAFFPFRDGLDALCDAGVAAVVQPGGSLRDEEVIEAANEREIAMVLTGERHFRH